MVQFDSGEWSPTMEVIFERIREKSEQVGMEKGLEKGLEQVVFEMLKKGFTTDLIAELTHLERTKIERLKETFDCEQE